MLPLAVIIGIRANAAEPDRARNLRLCLETLRAQDLASTEFQIVLIEQDHAPWMVPALTGLAWVPLVDACLRDTKVVHHSLQAGT